MTAPKKPAKTTAKRGAKRTDRDPFALKSPLKAKILQLAKQANDASIEAKQFAEYAVSHAHECGKLLIAEKAWLLEIRDSARDKLKLLKNNGQPATPQETFFKDADWQTWYDAQYASALDQETAERFIRLAKAHEDQTTFDFADSPNVMRSGLLALHIYPAKLHEEVEGDVPLEKPASHLAIVNRFVLWHQNWKKKHATTLTDNERGRLLADFGPLSLFIDELRAGSSIRK